MYKKIKEELKYSFSISTKGCYTVTIKASCKSGKLFGLFGGGDLRVEIDDIKLREIPAQDKPQYFHIPPTWNGTKLKGASKIIVFVLELKKGKHTIKFIPQREAIIEDEPKIFRLNELNNIEINLNEQAKKVDRCPWIAIILVNLPLNFFDVHVQCSKRKWDSDDIKLIIDDKIYKNKSSSWWGQNWYWQGKQMQGQFEEKRFYTKLARSIHYIEFWADGMPVLKKIHLFIEETNNAQDNDKNGDEILQKTVQVYDLFKGINGKENYNRFDKEIVKVVDYWNECFFKQEYPPEILLDYDLVKAIMYRESRIGYQKGGEIDVMQVGNEGDPALETLRGELEERELINGQEKKLNYQAKVESVEDSLYWGVRWLYHKAQGITIEKKRYWRSWQDAVLRYGPGKAEYVEYIWMIYKEGKDCNGKVENILWKKQEGGYIFLKLIVAIGIAMLIGWLGCYFSIKKICKEQISTEVIKKEFLAQEIHQATDKVFFEDLEDYKTGGVNRGDFFENTYQKCKDMGCMNQSIVYDKYKIIVENMKNNKHFLSAIDSLGADNDFYLRDIDNNGENEIYFLMYDPLNRDSVILSVIDKIDNSFSLIEKNIEWAHNGHFDIADLTGDLKPEIILYYSYGKGGNKIAVYQYNDYHFEEIFKNEELMYPEYTISDVDLDGGVEIKIKGNLQNITDYQEQVEKIYEYSHEQQEFVLIKQEEKVVNNF